VLTCRLNPEQLLAGQMPIDADAARRAIEDHIARPLGLDAHEAALAILTIVDDNMVLATRMVSVERGYDPRDFTLVAFGGAGPLHATSIAAELGIRHVLIPEAPGILCALGLLVTDMRADYVLTALGLTSRTPAVDAAAIWAELEQRADAWLDQEEIDASRRVLQRAVDMRYLGQNYELAVPAPAGAWDASAQSQLERRFHELHERAYGYASPDEPTQFVNFRLTAHGLVPHIALRRDDAHNGGYSAAAVVGERRVYWHRGADALTTPIYARHLLGPGMRLSGPAIVEQLDATTLVAPGHTARLDEYRNLHIELS
jgi:N-methylhydantoinase A